MVGIINWVKTKITTFGLFLGFSILQQYAACCMFFNKIFYEQYYKHIVLQNYMDYIFEWHHWFSTIVLNRQIEPLFNPWLSIFYMKSGEPNDGYHKIKIDTTTATATENESIFKVLDHFYYVINFEKRTFDVSDYLVLLKHKNTYISRVGVYQGQKNLRKEDFSMEKAAKSILQVEYTHPKMPTPIVLHIDPGYFIENNEILSPMFIQRALMYGSAPYVFDKEYKLKIMDSHIKTFILDCHSFILLKKQGYQIIKL